MANFGKRMIRAAKLEVTLYEEVEADKSALGQAMGVVILSSVAAGIGTISRGGGSCDAGGSSCISHRMVCLGVLDLPYWYKVTSRATD